MKKKLIVAITCIVVVCFVLSLTKIMDRGVIKVQITNKGNVEQEVWMGEDKTTSTKIKPNSKLKIKYHIDTEPTSLVFNYIDLDNKEKSIVISEYLGKYSYGQVKIKLFPLQNTDILDVQIEQDIGI